MARNYELSVVVEGYKEEVDMDRGKVKVHLWLYSWYCITEPLFQHRSHPML
jgi:hypothetical protein